MLGWVLRGMSLRGTCSALDWMQEMDVEWGFEFLVPHCTTVRLWLLRLGYYKLHRPKEQASDWVWIIDHSNQIGKEKCLVILGVRVSQLPPPGQEYPLCLAQMEPIELEPVTVSDKEVVYRQLEANVAKTGVPRAIIDDHGGDLAGGVELFRQAHPETIEIYDISHKAACLLKARLKHDAQWKAFAAKAGQTKCNIQQTEWAFLVPPSQRSKARYMNLGPLIAWGVKTLAIVDNPGPEVLQHGTRERLKEKLDSAAPVPRSAEGLVGNGADDRRDRGFRADSGPVPGSSERPAKAVEQVVCGSERGTTGQGLDEVRRISGEAVALGRATACL